MKNNLLYKCLTSLALIFCFYTPSAYPQTQTYQISATVPTITGSVFVLYRVTGDGSQASQWTSLGNSTVIDFGTLTLQTFTANGQTFQSLTAPYFFVIDIFPNAGGGVNHTMTYTDLEKPQGQTNGLGVKAVALFTQTVDGSTDIEIASRLLRDLTGFAIPGTSITAGRHLRIYLSLFDGARNAGLTGGEPFTPGDKPGRYAGTLTISVVAP